MSKTNNNKKSGGKKIISWIVAIAITAAVVSLAVFNQALDSGWLDRSMEAMATENFTVSIAGMEYFYRNVANSYISMLQSYGMSSYININSSTSHKLQECSMAESGTWFDFFLSMTTSEITKYLSCCEAAKAEGITLSDEDYTAIEDELEALEGTAKYYGYSLTQYLKVVYGSGVSADIVKSCLELQSLYNKYIEAHVDAADTSDEAVEKLYSENKNDYDKVEYLEFVFDYNDLYLDEEEQKKAETATTTTTTEPAESTEAVTESDAVATEEDPEEITSEDDEPAEEGADETTADTTTAAKTEEPREAYSTKDRDEAINKSRIDASELYEALQGAASAEEAEKLFNDFIKEYLTNEFGLTDAEYEKSKDSFKVSAVIKENDETLAWAFDEDTKAGDAKMFTEKEEHKHEEGDDHDELADVYTVVLLTKEASRDESLATADIRHILFSNDDYDDDTKAQEILEELKAVLGTEQFTAKFEELAKEYSADTSNKNNGGLMEDLAKGATVTEFDTWVFGGENSEGSLGIVETEDYGWHIVYFEKEGLPAWKNTIISEIEADAQTEAENKATDTYKVTQDDNKMSKWIDA